MSVVLNAGPVIHLSWIDRLDLRLRFNHAEVGDPFAGCPKAVIVTSQAVFLSAG